MNQFSCPKCGQSIDAAADAAGQRVQCAGCRALIVVPGGLAVPEVAPSVISARRREWNPVALRIVVFLVVLVFVALGLGGYLIYQRWFADNVSIYVDNNGDQPVVVRIDGEVKGTIASGTFGVVKCRDGKHRIQAKRGDETMFEEEKDLAKPNGNRPAQYLLNPGKTGRYHTHTVQYGIANSPWGIAAMQQKLRQQVPPVGDDANPFAGWNPNEVKNKIFWVANEVAFVAPSDWHDISKYDIVLERAPKVIKGNLMGRMEVFARIPRDDYDVLKAVGSNQEMTMQELKTAVRALERIADAELPR